MQHLPAPALEQELDVRPRKLNSNNIMASPNEVFVVEDTATESRAGSPSSWSIDPCDANNWSNDEGEYDKLKDEKGNLLVPCPSSGAASTSGQRPLSEAEMDQEELSSSSPSTGATSTSTSTSTTTATITSAAGEDDEDTGGKFVLDGRPDGFRPGVEVVNKATSGSPDTDTSGNGSVSSFSTALSSGATAGVVVGALVALVAAIIFLVARKRHRKDNGGDQATLISKGAAAAVASDDDDDAVNITTINDSFESDDGAHPIDADDSDAILADIESFGGHRLSSSAMVGAMMATTAAASTVDDTSVTSKNFNRSNNRNIELDPEAAAAYLAGGRVAAAAVTTKRRASNADLEAQEDDTVEGSFVSANPTDLGRRHSALHVTECNSGSCPGCRSSGNSENFDKIDFVPATTDDILLADGTKAWLANKVADCCYK